ncbi:Mitochondrial thiamine pyrophosphate carrier 1 [Intoshia linei]|uniref:Mitochondrial thiamine pyrophosphate carrier 1 n=1 Tax=Intoshia linei TaxID=1819745 RepID=A0A177B3A4_9BILA|nr:Mitochondrial thiamine pyrophosphate carrier 1 [Intoshia linei]
MPKHVKSNVGKINLQSIECNHNTIGDGNVFAKKIENIVDIGDNRNNRHFKIPILILPHMAPNEGNDISITKNEKERLRKLFNQLDTNQDNTLDLRELNIVLRPGKYEDEKTDFVEKNKKKSNSDNYMNFSQFIKFIIDREKKLKINFKRMDINNDGKIDLDEIMFMFKQLGFTITKIEANAMLKRMDSDNSLTIEWNEWRDFLNLQCHTDLNNIALFWRHDAMIDIGGDLTVADECTDFENGSGLRTINVISGAIAGAISRTCTAPLDRMKIFMQVKGTGESLNLKSCFFKLFKEGGLKSMWRGNFMNILKIAPETSLKFSCYEEIKFRINKMYGREESLNLFDRFLAGSMAGVVSQSAIYPMDVMKTRLAIARTGQYQNILHVGSQLYKLNGFRGFYNGYATNTLGIIPFAGLDLAIYESLKNRYYKYQNLTNEPSIFIILGSSVVSSTCAQLATYPLALIRTKLQATNKETKPSISKLISNIYKTKGLKGFYCGITPNFMKAIPSACISYVTYEKTKTYLKQYLD